MYAPPYALRSTTHSRGTDAAAYACTSSAPWRIIPRHSRSLPGSKPGVSTNVTSGRLKQSHHCTCRAAFSRRFDVDGAGPLVGLVGDHADGPAVEAGEAGDEVRRVPGPQLEERVVVEDVLDDRADVVGGVGPRRHRGRGAVAVAVDRVVGCDDGRVLEMVRRQVVEERGDRVERGVLVGDDHRCDAAAPIVHRGATEAAVVDVDAGEGADGVGPADVRERVARHDDDVGHPQQQRGPGHARADHGEHRRDDAGRARDRVGDPAPGVQRRDPFGDVGARRRDQPDDRDAELGGERIARSIAWPSGGPIAPTCLPPSTRNQLTVRPSISRELRGDGRAAVADERRRRRDVGQALAVAVSTKVAL